MSGPVFNLVQFDDSVQSRLRTMSSPPRLVGTADDFRDAIDRAVNLPAVFTMYKGSRSKGRLVQGHRRQLRDPLKLFLAIVAQSLMSRDRGHEAMYPILQPIEDRLAGFTPATALKPLIFDGDYFVMRDGPKVVYGAEFRTSGIDFTT